MNRILAVCLPIIWFLYFLIFKNHEYEWILEALLSFGIFYACGELWAYYDPKNDLIKVIRDKLNERG